MGDATNDAKGEESQPFAKGDRVVINYQENPGYHGVRGRVITAKFKRRPKWGKTPGWWVDVLLDPEKGIKRWTLEIHANHVNHEPDNDDFDHAIGGA